MSVLPSNLTETAPTGFPSISTIPAGQDMAGGVPTPSRIEPTKADLSVGPAMRKREPIRVVFLDREHDPQGELTEALRREGVAMTTVFCLAEATRVVQRSKIDLVLLRGGFPNAADFVNGPRRDLTGRALPVLLLREPEGEEQGMLELLRPRVEDFVSAPWGAQEVSMRIRRAVDREERERAMRESTCDPLILADENGRVLFSTASAERLLARYLGPTYAEKIAGALREESDNLTLDGKVRLRVERRGCSLAVVRIEEEPSCAAAALQILGLTRREAEILYWVSQGKTSPEAGVILGISADTVKKHVNVVLGKLGVETRTAAAMQAMRIMAQSLPRSCGHLQ